MAKHGIVVAVLALAFPALLLAACKPQEGAELMQRAELAFKMNDDAAALEAFGAVIHAGDVSREDRIHAYLMRARIYSRGHGYALALGQYNYVLKLAPGRADVHAARGLTRALLGDLEGALEDYDTALAQKPGDALTRRQRADALFDLGRIGEALKDYDAALKAFPEDALALAHRALARARLGQGKGARADAEKAAALAAGESWPHLIKIQILADTGAAGEALKALDGLLASDPQNARALHWRGWLNLSLNDLKAAARDLDAALELTPDDPGLHMTRADLFEKRADKGRAAAELSAALPMLNDEAKAQTLFRRAGLYFDLKDYNAAIADYSAVLDIEPNDPVVLNNRCWTKVQLGQLDAARRDCEAAARLAPDRAFILHSLAAVMEKLGRLEEAADYYRKAAALDPGNGALAMDAIRSAQPGFGSKEAVRVNVGGDANASRRADP